MLTAIVLIGIVALLAGAGTFAYFSDTSTSSGNKFDENAGNNFQEDTFNLTMIFTLKQ
jgi:predicted ribosomally synthesized peptide with SipW-like signal peptide